ncbi:MAG: methyltransferase domain-containing protein [Saccharothrix sp.]|nr:methyltransferase domain-containing protein [Saccharothrix sp.]
MDDWATARRWFGAHVETAAWQAVNAATSDNAVVAAARAVTAAGGVDARGAASTPPTWDALLAGAVDWVDLLDRPELVGSPHPAWRHVGAAAFLHAGRSGLLAGELPPWHPEQVDAVVRFGLRTGWFSSAAPVRAADEVVAMAGTSLSWFGRRLAFELDWFWRPAGAAADAARTGRPPATFGSPGPGAAAFRAAVARMNLPAAHLRLRAARAVGRVVGPASRVLLLGAAPGSWDGLGPTVVVDYPSVRAAVPSGHVDWVEQAPTNPPPVGRFDVVVAHEVLHIAPVSPTWVAEVADRVAPGGWLVIVEPLVTTPLPLPDASTAFKLALTGGGRLWTRDEVARALEPHGFVCSDVKQVAGVRFVVSRASPRRRR